MTQDNKPGMPQIRYGPISWLTSPLRAAIEQAVGRHKGCAWRIRNERDYSEFACHHVAILSDGSFSVFFKYSSAPEAKRQFEVELSDLHHLSKEAEILIPQPIDIVSVEDGTLLVMEAVETISRGPDQWREIGEVLARIHRVKSERCGFESNGFWGPLTQDNRPEQDWMTFFRDRRLRPLLKTAVDSGNLPSPVISDVERLIECLPQLCGPEATPTLLHGDAQQNNFVSTAEGAYVIDPAIFYGNPEWDLALIDAWQMVPDDVFDGYREIAQIDPEFPERRDLWRVPLYLAGVAVEGPIHLSRLTGAIRKYM